MCQTCCCPQPCGGGKPGGDGDGNPPPPRCTRFRLTVDSIDVSAIDDGFLGGNLEAVFTFVVNGQAKTYNNQDLGVGVTPIGISFFVDVPAESSTISFTVSGIEQDPFFDDTIAGFTQVFGQPENWGQGFQTGSASDSNIIYTLNYTITCARDVDVAISRAALLGYAREKAEMQKGGRADRTHRYRMGPGPAAPRGMAGARRHRRTVRPARTRHPAAARRTEIRRRWQRLTVTRSR